MHQYAPKIPNQISIGDVAVTDVDKFVGTLQRKKKNPQFSLKQFKTDKNNKRICVEIKENYRQVC